MLHLNKSPDNIATTKTTNVNKAIQRKMKEQKGTMLGNASFNQKSNMTTTIVYTKKVKSMLMFHNCYFKSYF